MASPIPSSVPAHNKYIAADDDDDDDIDESALPAYGQPSPLDATPSTVTPGTAKGKARAPPEQLAPPTGRIGSTSTSGGMGGGPNRQKIGGISVETRCVFSSEHHRNMD